MRFKEHRNSKVRLACSEPCSHVHRVRPPSGDLPRDTPSRGGSWPLEPEQTCCVSSACVGPAPVRSTRSQTVQKTPHERGLHIADRLEDSFIGTVEQRRDLIDAEEGIGIEDEGEEELAGGEFRVVERRSSGVGGFLDTAPTPDPRGAVESAGITVRADSAGPDGLESPLDDGVKRLGAELITPRSTNCSSILSRAARSMDMDDCCRQDAVASVIRFRYATEERPSFKYGWDE